jgi:hypothetical protein
MRMIIGRLAGPRKPGGGNPGTDGMLQGPLVSIGKVAFPTTEAPWPRAYLERRKAKPKPKWRKPAYSICLWPR